MLSYKLEIMYVTTIPFGHMVYRITPHIYPYPYKQNTLDVNELYTSICHIYVVGINGFKWIYFLLLVISSYHILWSSVAFVAKQLIFSHVKTFIFSFNNEPWLNML